MAIGHTRSATPLARPVDLSGTWNATDDEVASRFHPLYRGGPRTTAGRRLGIPGPAIRAWAPGLPGGAGSSSATR